MEIRVHPRVRASHPEIADEDAIAAFHSTLRSAPRVGSGFPRSGWMLDSTRMAGCSSILQSIRPTTIG